MSQLHARDQFAKITKYIVLFAVASIVMAILAATSAHAQLAPQEPVTIPASCSATAPLAGEPGIHFAPTTPTNVSSLQWNWTFTAPAVPPVEEVEEGEEAEEAEAPFVYTRYNYAIYSGDVLQTQGILDPAATTVGYVAPADGTYTLYLWTVEGEADAETSTYCSVASIPLDATPPAVSYQGHLLDDNIATPLITSDGSDYTYSWTVNRLGGGVRISDPTALAPSFSFQRDGTYNFVLTALDTLGNSTVVEFSITYLAPFVAPPNGPEIIPVESIPEPIQTYVPIEEAAPIAQRTYRPAPSGDGMISPEIDASIYSITSEGQEARANDQKKVAGAAVSAGSDGWKVLGLSWYWWLLIAAIIVSAWLWLTRTYRSRFSPDDI